MPLKKLKTKKMNKLRLVKKTTLSVNKCVEGETIEAKMRRITTEKSPIGDASPIVYTERKDGVLPQYDIRADKWDIALEAMSKVSQMHEGARKKRQEAKVVNLKKDGETPANTSDTQEPK